MTALGDRAVCRCGRVIVAVKDRRVISLTAGVWVHARLIDRLRCARPSPP